MELNKKQKQAIRKIFTNPRNNPSAQNILDNIFQTQVYLLGINDEDRRREVIYHRNTNLVNELRYGKESYQHGLYYKAEPVDKSLSTDDNFWTYVCTLLDEAVKWNYQKNIIKESLKKKVFMHFLADPTKSLYEHAITLQNILTNHLLHDEKEIFNKEFAEIANWAQIASKEYSEVSYPVLTAALALTTTLVAYSADALSLIPAFMLSTAEITATYLWGKYFTRPTQSPKKLTRNLLDEVNNDFLNENKLMPVCINTNTKEAETIIYSKFNEKLPDNAWLFNNTDEKDDRAKKFSRHQANQLRRRGEVISVQPGKEKNPAMSTSSKEEEKLITPTHVWGTISIDNADIKTTWGHYSQKNTYTLFDKTSPSIQNFKKIIKTYINYIKG